MKWSITPFSSSKNLLVFLQHQFFPAAKSVQKIVDFAMHDHVECILSLHFLVIHWCVCVWKSHNKISQQKTWSFSAEIRHILKLNKRHQRQITKNAGHGNGNPPFPIVMLCYVSLPECKQPMDTSPPLKNKLAFTFLSPKVGTST